MILLFKKKIEKRGQKLKQIKYRSSLLKKKFVLAPFCLLLP
jgi:hypothetical protein